MVHKKARRDGETAPPLIAIVVPCYNEADRLAVNAFLAHAKQHINTTFWFVDDGSKDATRTVIESLVAQNPTQMRLHALPKNQGKAEAVRQGIEAALATNAQFVGFWDADLATPLSDIPIFAQIMTHRTPVNAVIGSRIRMLGYRIKRQPLRHYVGRAFATAASVLLRLPVYDTQCGAKMFRNVPSVRAAFSEPFLANWIFDVEILMRMYVERREAGLPVNTDFIVEQPVSRWEDVEGSKVKPTAAFEAARDLARMEIKYGRHLRGARPKAWEVFGDGQYRD